MIKRYETKKIYVGDVVVGGDAPIYLKTEYGIGYKLVC